MVWKEVCLIILTLNILVAFKEAVNPDYIRQFFSSSLTQILWQRIRPNENVSRGCQNHIVKTLKGFREGSTWAYQCKFPEQFMS